MSKLIVGEKGATIDQSDEIVDVSTVYDKNFLYKLNLHSANINETSKSDYLNEIFIYFFVPLIEKVSYLKIKAISTVEISTVFCGPEGVFWQEAAARCNIKNPLLKKAFFIVKSSLLLFYAFFTVLIYSFSLPIYTLFKYKSDESNTPSDNESIAIIRSLASLSKMQFLKEQGVAFFYDDLSFKANERRSIYLAPLGARFLGLLLIPYRAISDFFQVYNVARRLLGFMLAGEVAKYYIKRIPHKATFEYYAEYLIKENQQQSFYTGNKEDRFAMLEQRLCKTYKLKCICIPHGLEYSYMMPSGLVGEDFYCTSKFAKVHLEKIYQEYDTNFIFDQKIVEKMLSIDSRKTTDKKIVFFPESREPKKNLLIIKKLHSLGIEFYLKLHVKDDINNYMSYVTEEQLISDFCTAITNNICLARKSTVLLEAIYNGSQSIAVLTDEKDRRFVELIFPSLNDQSILKIYSLENLTKLLKRLDVKNV